LTRLSGGTDLKCQNTPLYLAGAYVSGGDISIQLPVESSCFGQA